MLEKLIKKVVIKDEAKEYETLGKLIVSSPIEIFDYDLYLKELKNLSLENKKFLKNKNFAIFYDLKVLSVDNKQYMLPDLNNVLSFLKGKFTIPVLSIMLAENFEQCLISYIRENK